MSSSQYRVVAIDIDGTLLSTRHEILPSTKEWIARVQAADGHVMISSGRPLSGVTEQVRRGGLDRPLSMSGYNGAIARDREGVRVVDHRMDLADAREVLRFARNLPVSRMACVDDLLLVDDPDGYLVRHEAVGNNMEMERIDDLDELTVAPHKLLFAAEPPELVAAREELWGAFGRRLEVTTSAPIYCELAAPGASKGTSLQSYCDAIGVPIEQAIAFGDADNDRTMIEMAGLGVAMGNATDQIKAIADRVTLSNDDGGIAAVLEEFFG